MNEPIDIYADNPVVTLAYKIAVMQKALEMGEYVVQCEWLNAKNQWAACCDGAPRWDWFNTAYRIDPATRPFVMPGYNPWNLNQYEVGLSYGWRLLHEEERNQLPCRHSIAVHNVEHATVGRPPSWYASPRPTDTVFTVLRTKLNREQFFALFS